MFSSVEHKFSTVKHKFSTVEHRFSSAEHNLLLGEPGQTHQIIYLLTYKY